MIQDNSCSLNSRSNLDDDCINFGRPNNFADRAHSKRAISQLCRPPPGALVPAGERFKDLSEGCSKLLQASGRDTSEKCPSYGSYGPKATRDLDSALLRLEGSRLSI